MWASTRCPFCSSTRNIALGSGSTTRPSTSMAPSFFAMPGTRSLTRWYSNLTRPRDNPDGCARWLQIGWCRQSREGVSRRAATARRRDGANAVVHCTPAPHRSPTRPSVTVVMAPSQGPVASGASAGGRRGPLSRARRDPERRQARDAAVLGGEDPRALGRDRHRVLEVRRTRAVLGDDRPAVLQLGGGGGAHGHPPLHGQRPPPGHPPPPAPPPPISPRRGPGGPRGRARPP